MIVMIMAVMTTKKKRMTMTIVISRFCLLFFVLLIYGLLAMVAAHPPLEALASVKGSSRKLLRIHHPVLATWLRYWRGFMAV